jgi:hypothetical protein
MARIWPRAPVMPEKKTHDRARADKRAGKSESTQAGEYVREEMHHIREGKHGARSAKQAIAIGLSKARRDGVALKPGGSASPSTKKRAKQDVARSKSKAEPSPKRARASTRALEHEGHAAASTTALSRHAHAAARARKPSARSASAKKAARTRKTAAAKRSSPKTAKRATPKKRSTAERVTKRSTE